MLLVLAPAQTSTCKGRFTATRVAWKRRCLVGRKFSVSAPVLSFQGRAVRVAEPHQLST